MEKKSPSLRAALSDSFIILDPDQPVKIDDIPVKELSLSTERLRRALNPPYEPTGKIMHDVLVKTPFKPLEDMDAPETLAWVERQNKKTDDYLASAAASLKATKKALTEAKNEDSIGTPRRYGDIYVRTYQKALSAQMRLEVSAAANGPWETLVDPLAINKKGTVSITNWSVSADGRHLVYVLNEGGGDKKDIHILDIETRKSLPEVFATRIIPAAVPEAVTILWDKDGKSGFTYGGSRGTVRHHVIGQPPENDGVVFEPSTGWAWPLRLSTAKYDWIYEGSGTEKAMGLSCRPQGSDEPFKQVLAPRQFTLQPIAERKDGTVLAITNHGAARNKLIAFNPDDAAPEKWQTVIPESKDVLNTVSFQKGRLLAIYTHEAADDVKVFTPEGKYLNDIPLPPQSLVSFAGGNNDQDKLALKISGFKSNGDYYTYDFSTNALAFDKKGSGKIDLNDCIVERLYATSKDGTTVPMTVIRRPDVKLDGTAAVRMTGYGGFKNVQGPAFSSTAWHFVNSGGIYVQTNLRGGGEFGDEWYNQGRKLNKQNTFDDFAACAEKLVAEKYTSSKRLVIQGGSNGGLLTSATLLQHPELFGAVVTRVPVTDMLALNGSWASDYGQPSNLREDFNAAARYSPVQNVKQGAKYPPHLIITADHDDRVAPSHAYKLAATLQAQSHKDNVVLLRVRKDAGHGGGNALQEIQKEAETTAFIEKAIGPIDQEAYKATLATAVPPLPQKRAAAGTRKAADKFRPAA